MTLKKIDKGTEKEQIFYEKFHLILKKYNDEWKLVVDYDSNEGGSIGEEEFMKAYSLDDYDKFLQ
jgi:hypothetical protein